MSADGIDSFSCYQLLIVANQLLLTADKNVGTLNFLLFNPARKFLGLANIFCHSIFVLFRRILLVFISLHNYWGVGSMPIYPNSRILIENQILSE